MISNTSTATEVQPMYVVERNYIYLYVYGSPTAIPEYAITGVLLLLRPLLLLERVHCMNLVPLHLLLLLRY